MMKKASMLYSWCARNWCKRKPLTQQRRQNEREKKRKLKGSVTCIVGNMRDMVILVFCASLAFSVSEAWFQSGYLTSLGDIFAGLYAELESTANETCILNNAWNIVQKHGLQNRRERLHVSLRNRFEPNVLFSAEFPGHLLSNQMCVSRVHRVSSSFPL